MRIAIKRSGILRKALAATVLLPGLGGVALAASPCPPSITTPGTVFELSDDLVCPTEAICTCVRVRADDVIVRLNGHSITGNGGDIFAPPGSPLRTTGISMLVNSNVVIEGPGKVSNFARGVAVIGSSNVGIYDVEISGNQRGIQISARTVGGPATPTRDVEIHGTTIKDTETQGVVMTGFTSQIHLVKVEIENSGLSGILFTNRLVEQPPTNNLVQRCEIKNSGFVGVHLLGSTTDTTVSECKITGSNIGVQVGGGSGQVATDTKIRDSVIANNQTGVSVTSASLDTKLRRNCFENNNFARDISDNSPDGAALLGNVFDPVEGCE